MSDDDDDATTAAPPSALVLSRIFAGKERDDAPPGCSFGDEPLERCLRWLDDEARSQTVVDATTGRRERVELQFIVIGRVRGGGSRWCDYEACDVSTLRARRERSAHGEPRYEDEIVGSGRPVHAYVDIDVDDLDATKTLESMRLHVVSFDARVFAAAQRLYGIAKQRACHYDASKSDKFSRHIVYHWHDADGREVAFRSASACGAFMRSHDEPMIDRSVYNRNHALRMYGSSKPDGTRPFLRVVDVISGECEPPLQSFEWSRVAESLVTLVSPDARLVGTTAADAAPAGRKRSSPSPNRSYEVSSDDERRLVESIEPIVAAGIRHVKRSGALLYVDIDSRYCDRKSGAHANATVYYVVDTEQRRYRQCCHASSCKQLAPTAWRSYKRATPPPRSTSAPPLESAERRRPLASSADDVSLSSSFDRASIVATLF